MAADSDKLSGAEEYVTATIELRENLAPDQEKSLRVDLGKFAPHAVNSCDIGARKISLCYDPTRISQKRLIEIIERAGGAPGHIQSDGSPLLHS